MRGTVSQAHGKNGDIGYIPVLTAAFVVRRAKDIHRCGMQSDFRIVDLSNV